MTLSPAISALLSVSVMSLVPVASATSPAGAETVTVVASLSAREIVSESMDATPVAAPETVIVSSYSSVLSSVGVSVKDPVCDSAPAGIVIVKLLTAAKSTTSLPPEPATLTVTAVSLP